MLKHKDLSLVCRFSSQSSTVEQQSGSRQTSTTSPSSATRNQQTSTTSPSSATRNQQTSTTSPNTATRNQQEVHQSGDSLDMPDTGRPLIADVYRKHIIPWYDKDKVSRDCRIIYSRSIYKFGYKNTLYPLIPIFLGLTIAAFLLFPESEVEYVVLPVTGLEVKNYVLVYCVCMLLLSARIAWMCRRIDSMALIRVYQTPEQDKFIGIARSGLRGETKMEFSLDDVVPQDFQKKFKSGNFTIQDRSFTLFIDDFITDAHFNRFQKVENKPVSGKQGVDSIVRKALTSPKPR